MRKVAKNAKVDPLEIQLKESLPEVYATETLLKALKLIPTDLRDEAIAAIKKTDELVDSDPRFQETTDLKEHLAHIFLPRSLLIYDKAPGCVSDTFQIALDIDPDSNEDSFLAFLDQSFVPCLVLFSTKYEIIDEASKMLSSSGNDPSEIVPPEEISVDNYVLIDKTREVLRSLSDKATKENDPLAGQIAGIRGIIESDDSLRRFLLQENYKGSNLVDIAGSLLSKASRFPLHLAMHPHRYALEKGIEEAHAVTMSAWKLSKGSAEDVVSSPDYLKIFGTTPLVSKAFLIGEKAGEFSAYIHRGIALPEDDIEECRVKISGGICKAYEGQDRPFDVTISPLQGGVPIALSVFFTNADEFHGYCPARIENGELIIDPSPLFTDLKTLEFRMQCDLEDANVILVRSGDTLSIHRQLNEEPVLTIPVKGCEEFITDITPVHKHVSARTIGNGDNIYYTEEDDISDSLYSALELINCVRGTPILPHLDNIFVTKNGPTTSGFLPLTKRSQFQVFDTYIRETDDPFLQACELVALDRRRALYLSSLNEDELILNKNEQQPLVPSLEGAIEGVEVLVGSIAIADFVCDALRLGYISKVQARTVVSGLLDLSAMERQLRPFMTSSLSQHFESFRAKVTSLNEALKVVDESESEYKAKMPGPIAVSGAARVKPEILKSAAITLDSLSITPYAIWSESYKANKHETYESLSIGALSEIDSSKLSDRLSGDGLNSTDLIGLLFSNEDGDDLLGRRVQEIEELIEDVEALFLRLEERRIVKSSDTDKEDLLSGIRRGLRREILNIFDEQSDDVEDVGLSEALEGEAVDESEDYHGQFRSYEIGENLKLQPDECDLLIDFILDNDREGFLEAAYKIADKLRLDPLDLYLESSFKVLRESIPTINSSENIDELMARHKFGLVCQFLGFFLPQKLIEDYEQGIRYIVELATATHYEKKDVGTQLGKLLETMTEAEKIELEDLIDNVQKHRPEDFNEDLYKQHVIAARVVCNDPNEQYVAVVNRIVSSLPSRFLLASAFQIFQDDPEKFFRSVKRYGVREEDLQTLSLSPVETALLALELHGAKDEKTLTDLSEGFSISPFELVERKIAQIRSYMQIRPPIENPHFDNAVLFMLPTRVLEDSLKGLAGAQFSVFGFGNLASALRKPEFFGDNATKEFLHSIAWETIRTFFDAEAYSDDADSEESQEDIKKLRAKREALKELGVDTTAIGIEEARRAIGFYQAKPEALPPTSSFEDLKKVYKNGPKALESTSSDATQ